MRLTVIAAATVVCLASLPASGQNAQAAGTDAQWLTLAANGQTASAPAGEKKGAPTTAPAVACGTEEVCPADPLSAKGWEVRFKIYMWIPGQDGTAGIGRVRKHIDVDYSDVFNAFKDIEAIVPVNLEVWLGRWGVYSDLCYTRFVHEVKRKHSKISQESEQAILEIAGMYRAGMWGANAPAAPCLLLDLIAGVRYNSLGGTIGIQTARRDLSIGRTEEWWDPIVGARLTWRPGDKLDVFARVDIGGFDISGCSRLTTEFIGGVDYYFTRNLFGELGYRLLYTDFIRGTGRDHFEYEILMQGPYLAVGLRF